MKKILLSIFCLLGVVAAQADEVTDVLNRDITGITSTSYSSWSGKTATSDAVYAGQSAGSNESIQLRSNNSNSGIITTTSGGKVKTITVTWNSNTASGRTLSVYGKNNAYSSPTDLYNASNQGTLLGTIVNGTSTSLTIDGDYEYIGLRSKSGAMYLTEIQITWTTGGEGGDTPDPVDVAEPTFTPADGATFEESLDVTINAEEGLTVYYSTDNKVSFTEGNNVNITETTTVYAYAKDAEGNQSDVVSATYTKLVPVDPNAKEVEATISFASTTQRVSQGADQQVWQNEGVTFTNNKANSSTNVANYSDPVRLYGGSNVVIEHEAMTKILFVVSESKYVSPLVNSIGTTATTATDGNNVTVTFVNPVDEFIASLTAQVRLSSLTVTYLTTQKVVKAPVITPESYGFYAGENVEVTITAEEGTIYYTTDGNEPTTLSEVYSAPFTVSETTTVKAIAVVDGTESEVATAVYTKGIEGTVTDAFDAYVDGERLPAAVTGYIVGYVNGSAVGDEGADCVFGAENVEISTNILIAGDRYETDYTKCLAVQLPNNEIRAALNLVDNPENYQAKVVIKGSLEKYLNTAGLKDLDAGELVDELYHTLTVSEAGWSTLYLGFNARIPSTVEAYTVTTVNDGWVALELVTGVLPAETGVIVKADQGAYEFVYSADAAAVINSSLLKGTVAATDITPVGTAYVLSAPDSKVGLYQAALTDGAFLNNANKAYLDVTNSNGIASYSFNFDWNGTTGIEGVEAENGAVKGIYDLTGRRIDAITAPGIYIIDGVKTIVK